MAETLAEALIVLHPFRSYRKGDVVRDTTTITQIKASVSSTNYVLASIPSVAPAENKR